MNLTPSQERDLRELVSAVTNSFDTVPFTMEAVKRQVDALQRVQMWLVDTPTIATEMQEYEIWHKVCGALVLKYGEQRLTVPEFAALEGKAVVVAHDKGGTEMVLKVLPADEAARLSAMFQRDAKEKN